MTLRINVMEDETFRKDLIAMATGVLRSVADSVIRDTIKADGWLSNRVDKFFSDQPLAGLVDSRIRGCLEDRSTWNKPMIIELIEKRIKQEVGTAIGNLHTKYEARISELVAIEIRKKFAAL